MQTGSSETLIGWKSGKTTNVPLWDRMEGAWLYGLSTATKKIPFMYSFSGNCAASIKRAIYIFQGSVRIFSCSRIGRLIVGIYKSLWSPNSFSGNICFKFSVLFLCSVGRRVVHCCCCATPSWQVFTLRRDAAVFLLSSRLPKVVVLPNN
jgi:hypothetical protein